jgi:hypothetical protein
MKVFESTQTPSSSMAECSIANAGNDDATRIEEIFECAASHSVDWTAAVFTRFIQRCPRAAEHFTILDPTMPPLGCGQMLFEATCLVMDSANGQRYVDTYVKQIVAEHSAFDIKDFSLYREFFCAMRDVLMSLIGDDWTDVRAAAWERQISALVARGFR